MASFAPDQIFLKRRARLRRRLNVLKLDALLVTNVHNVRYLTGFTGEDSALLVTREGDSLVTDGRFTEQAQYETTEIEIVTRRKPLMQTCGARMRSLRLQEVGFEADSLSVQSHSALAEAAGKTKLSRTLGEVERLRQIKDSHEIAAIRRAIKVAEEAFAEVREQIRAGITELELARAIEIAMLRRGAQCPAFPTIVAFGERASLPHARPTARRLRAGESVLLDWGARVDFYNSDLTRVLFLDRIPPQLVKVYSIVLEAQRRALGRIRAGETAQEIDRAARSYIRRKRFGSYFRHGLGHSLGLEVHEAPSLREGLDEVLKPGMVFTVEPGIYMPRRGGVRIEDVVLVTRSGSRVLTNAPKSLMDSMVCS